MNCRLLIITALLFAVGCAEDLNNEPIRVSNNKIFKLSIESFSDKVVGTRSTDNDNIDINRGYIFFYSSNGTYKGYESVENLNIGQVGNTVTFETGDNYSTSDKIIAIFNHDENAALPSDFSKVTSENLNSYFSISDEYLAKIEEDCNSKTYALGMPMYLNDFTDSDRTIREVYRSVARMELFIKNGLTIEHDSHHHAIGPNNLEFTIVNDISKSPVGIGSLPLFPTDEECFDTNSFDGEFPYSLTGYDGDATDTQNKVYLHRFPYSTRSIEGEELDDSTFDENRFAIILKHGDKNVTTSADEARYYKLNLLDKVASSYFDVNCNHSYRVVITAVNSRGYDTIEEAYKMPPSNIEYEIYDDKGGITYSNGQYAISMDEILSYDEILVYGSNETKLEFNNIRYVLPDGGQMDNSEFITNEVAFSKISDSDGLITDINSDFSFDSNGKSTLTSKGQSITVTLEGEGECTIALKIKLGNLEMGRDQIKIRKVATNGGGDGSFDAHPNHIEIPNQLFVDGSWQSNDIDFGARASSLDYDDIDGGTVVYMGENATPTGFRTMDGLISGEHSINSYPVFSPKTRKGYYSYKDAAGETHKVMIQLNQLAPFYLGHFGSTASDESLYHYNGLICEKIEEIAHKDWAGEHETGGILMWAEAQKTFYTDIIWGDYLGLGNRYHNLVDGLKVTRNIVENNTVSPLPIAARYCYMKNDINGNGKVDNNEPIVWYMPAQNQMLAMWINMNVFNSDIDLYKLNRMGDNPYYWTSSEVDDVYEYKNSTPSDFSTYVVKFNMLEGQSDYEDKSSSWGASHVRCVRGLD